MSQPQIFDAEKHQATMKFLFNQVCDPKDWKGPIKAVVPWDMANVYLQAINYMTATDGQVTLLSETETRDLGLPYQACCIVSEGYRMGPAGDH